MKMNLLLASFLFLPTFLHTAEMEDKAQYFLRLACQTGAFVPGKNAAPQEHLRNHYKKSHEYFKQKLPLGHQKVILILGPGPCKDTPPYDLLMTYDKVIMIDGNDQLVKDWLAHPNYAKLAKKTDVHSLDLTGGLYRFIADKEQEIAKAINQDEHLCTTQNKCDAEHYERLLASQNFVLDLAQFKPNVVVSWMVTSQLTNLSLKIINQIRESHWEVSSYTEMETSNQQLPSVENLLKFTTTIERLNKKYSEQAYFSGIKNSGAQYVFYANDIPNVLRMADENTELGAKNVFANLAIGSEENMGLENINSFFDSTPSNILLNDFLKNTGEFDKFRQSMQGNFRIEAMPNAWAYDDKRQGDIYAFFLKPRCNNCLKQSDKLFRCAACKSVEYCDKGCQRAHWAAHKDACKQAQRLAPKS